MRLIWKRAIVGVVALAIVLLGGTALAADNGSKMQFYFAPQMMNDVSGEVVVDVNLRNFSIAVPKSMGDLCGFTFAFTYDDTQFTLYTDEAGKADVLLDDKTLVRSRSDLEIAVDGRKITVDFMDGTLKDRLIHSDGTLFRFRLKAKNVAGIWNSFETYPLCFVPGSVGAVAYRVDTAAVSSCYRVEGIDGRVGGYQPPQAIEPPAVGKTFEFTQGDTQMTVGDAQIEMDVPVILLEGKTMLPIRFLAEHAGMKVEWDADMEMVSAYTTCRTLKIRTNDGRMYLNSMPMHPDISPVVISDRTYISTETVTEVWKDATVNDTEGKISIYLP